MASLFQESGDPSNGYLVINGVTCLFQSIPEGLSDGRSVNYEVKEISKRSEPLLIYQATGFREISFSLKFGAKSDQDAYDMFKIANLIRYTAFPLSNGIPPICKVNLGPFFVYQKVSGDSMETDPDYSEDMDGMKCIIKSYTLTPGDKRFESETLTGAGGPSGWNHKAPADLSIALGVYVFLGSVWGTGSVG